MIKKSNKYKNLSIQKPSKVNMMQLDVLKESHTKGNKVLISFYVSPKMSCTIPI